MLVINNNLEAKKILYIFSNNYKKRLLYSIDNDEFKNECSEIINEFKNKKDVVIFDDSSLRGDAIQVFKLYIEIIK